MINYMDLVIEGYKLRDYAKETVIPYDEGGHTLVRMDCAGACEYLLVQLGLPEAIVRLRSSNKHWRQSLKWRGSIEECIALFGEIPEGAWLFIHSPIDHKNYPDGQGDAKHMGQYLDYLTAVHASESRKMVLESAVKNKSINGGWNAVGLNIWTTFAPHVEAKLGNSVDVTNQEEDAEDTVAPAPVVTPAAAKPAPKQYVLVVAANGKPVRIREVADPTIHKKGNDAACGSVLPYKGSTKDGKYFKVLFNNKTRLLDKDYGVMCDRGGTPIS